MREQTRKSYGSIIKTSCLSLIAMASVMVPAPQVKADSTDDAGVITFYNFPAYIGATELADFAKAYPEAAKIKLVDSPSTTSAPQVLAQDLSRWDMAYLDTISAPKMWKNGQLQALDRSKLPNLKYVQPKFLDILPPACIPTDYGQIGFLYNSKIIKEPMNSWVDFWRVAQEYRGKVVIENTQRDMYAIAMLENGLDTNSMKPDDIAKATASLIELKKTALEMTSDDMYKPLLNGSAVMGIDYDFEAAQAVTTDPDLKWVFPTDGAVTYFEGWCAIAGTKHLADIEKFMNFQLDPKNYAGWVNATGASYVTPAVGQYLSPQMKYMSTSKILAPSPHDAGYGPISGNAQRLYSRGWNEVLAN